MKQSDENIVKQIERRDLFGFILLTMRVAAMYPLSLRKENNCLNYLIRIADGIYEIFTLFVSVHIAALFIGTIYIYYGQGDLEFLVNCLLQTIIYTWTIAMKLYFRRVRPKLLTQIISFINDKHQLRSAPGFTYVTVRSALRQSNLWIKSYVYCCFVGTIFWLALPIVYRDRSLPLSCWYPFDYKQPYVYQLVFFLQAMGQIQVAAAFSASSGFHMVLSILTCGQYDILFCSLKNVLATSYLKMGANLEQLSKLREAQSVADAEPDQYSYSLEILTPPEQLIEQRKPSNNMGFYGAFKQSFTHCLQQHRYIISILQKMESFYNPIWLFKIGEVTFLMCLVAFVSTKSTTANSFMRMVSLGQYLLLVVYELFIICYFADIVYQNSQRCGEALWRSPWHLHMHQLRRDYIIFMINSRREFRLTAGKIYNLNVDRLRGTITTAFSFLTLLQKLDARG
ncbi:odorant receptor 83a [Drosophila grimshawi]|uniref:Odorant receptor n=1 Tax=Drosophila grimshawi TaxID=7222 RepID=B4JSM1_DROGR|nr:odorant receptor 83a [Drosophila grimshawi]EDV94761.1 GH22619 [Drosophila grimshawi]